MISPAVHVLNECGSILTRLHTNCAGETNGGFILFIKCFISVLDTKWQLKKVGGPLKKLKDSFSGDS